MEVFVFCFWAALYSSHANTKLQRKCQRALIIVKVLKTSKLANVKLNWWKTLNACFHIYKWILNNESLTTNIICVNIKKTAFLQIMVLTSYFDLMTSQAINTFFLPLNRRSKKQYVYSLGGQEIKIKIKVLKNIFLIEVAS